MKKIIIGLLALASISAFADSMNCVAHTVGGSIEDSLVNMNRYGKNPTGVSGNTLKGFTLAIEMDSRSLTKENVVLQLMKISKDQSYAFYGMNDRYVQLCIKN